MLWYRRRAARPPTRRQAIRSFENGVGDRVDGHRRFQRPDASTERHDVEPLRMVANDAALQGGVNAENVVPVERQRNASPQLMVAVAKLDLPVRPVGRECFLFE